MTDERTPSIVSQYQDNTRPDNEITRPQNQTKSEDCSSNDGSMSSIETRIEPEGILRINEGKLIKELKI